MDNGMMIAVVPVPGEKQVEKHPGRINVAEELIRARPLGHRSATCTPGTRNLQTVDPGLFARQVAEVRNACPLVIEGSTAGRRSTRWNSDAALSRCQESNLARSTSAR